MRTEAADIPLSPGGAVESIVTDHGRIYISEHVESVCARLGVSIQPARVYTPTDKAVCERFFRTLRESLLIALPGYKGPDIHSRGADPEAEAYFFTDELEQIIRHWISEVYHQKPHAGLVVPEAPGVPMSPMEMHAYGLARAGCLRLPTNPDVAYDFLKTTWRTIQHYGVQIDYLRYSCDAVLEFAGRESAYTERHSGKWCFRYDPADMRQIYFQHPVTNAWHTLNWERRNEVNGPFSMEALRYIKRLAINDKKERYKDLPEVCNALINRWQQNMPRGRQERKLALKHATAHHMINLDETSDLAKYDEVFRNDVPNNSAELDESEEILDEDDDAAPDYDYLIEDDSSYESGMENLA